MEKTDVAVVGAGPYGLAIAAHLEHAGVDRVVFGDPGVTWRDNMPRGMLLKSEPYGSDIAAPLPGQRARDFCELRGIEYRERGLPLAVETFSAYAQWYWTRLVADVRQVKVTSVSTAEGGFHLVTDAGDLLAARSVVVATGLMPFVHIPGELGGGRSALVSHAWDHSDPAALRGLHVGVIGAGQSALETAVLLHESGVDVEVLARVPKIHFSAANPDPTGWWSLVRSPVTKTGDGWHSWFYHCLPDAFRALPGTVRLRKGLGFLGPSGAPWLRPRFEGRVAARAGVRIRSSRPVGDRIRLELDGGADAEFDHVIAGTGYRLDVDRLSFLDPDLRARIARAGGAASLGHGFESSVEGLYFVGAMSAPSLGPSNRFLSGTYFASRRVTARLRRARHPIGPVDRGREPAAVS